MNYLGRSFLSIIKRPFKSLILLLIIFLLGNLLVGSYIILETSSSLEYSIKSRIGALATIRSNLENDKIRELPYESRVINSIFDDLKGVLEEISDLDGIIDLDYRSSGLQYSFISYDLYRKYGEVRCRVLFFDDLCHDYQSRGIATQNFNELRNQIITIKEGRNFTQEEILKGTPVALIQYKDNTFHRNGDEIKIGDTLTFTRIAWDDSTILGTEIDLEEPVFIHSADYEVIIIGSFEGSAYAGWTSDTGEGDKPIIFFPSNFLVQVRDKIMADYESVGLSPQISMRASLQMDDILIFIDSVDSMPRLEEEMQGIIDRVDSEHGEFHLVTSTDEFDKLSGPINNMKAISQVALIAAVIATITILSLVINIFLRDRKYELGIYISLGEKTSRIILQIVLEVLVISFFAISLSFFSGQYLAKSMSNWMIGVQRKQDLDEIDTSLTEGLTQDKILDEYKIELDIGQVMGTYLISMVTVLVSTAIPVIYISRLKPKEILM